MDIINTILDSWITVMLLGFADGVILVLLISAIVKSERSTYNFEKMNTKFKNKKRWKLF